MAIPFSRSGTRRLHSEINVTPFVDVMLVLLVIFMVTAPLMYQGMDVNLPETTTQALRVRDNPLILSVQQDGKVFVGRKEVPMAELQAKLEAVFEARTRPMCFYAPTARRPMAWSRKPWGQRARRDRRASESLLKRSAERCGHDLCRRSDIAFG